MEFIEGLIKVIIVELYYYNYNDNNINDINFMRSTMW